MATIPLEDLDEFGANAPRTNYDSADEFAPPADLGVSEHRLTYPNGAHLDALLVNRAAGLLVVSLHGATNRANTQLPRYERLRSLNAHDVSALYVGDPALWLDDRLQLAWYTGWVDVDLHEVIAQWVSAAARKIGAKRIIITGASGGGFAALQVAAHVPGSLALAFNPQTDITEYRVNGEFYGAQHDYVRTLWPNILAEYPTPAALRDSSWGDPIRERVSAVARYSRPTKNYIHFVQNVNEFHMEEHFDPFVRAVIGAGAGYRLHAVLYEGGTMHNPPPQDVFERELNSAICALPALPEFPIV